MTIPIRYPWYISVIILILTIVSAAQAKYSGGSGVPDDPYQIATAEDLMLLGETPEDYDKHFILTADIDLDPNLPGRKVFDKAVIAPGNEMPDWPYFQGTPFTGVFNGNGYIVSHLTIVGKDYLGLFGQLGTLDTGVEVKNLGIVDVSIVGSGGFIGGLAGENQGSVTNCYITGTVKGSDGVGGLVGQNDLDSVTNFCYSADTISGKSDVGGLVGENLGDVTACSSACTVSADASIGGLVGFNGGNVTGCHSSCATTGDYSVGGLVGENGGTGTVTQCYSTGTAISYDEWVGGLVGFNDGDITARCSTGATTGDYSVGGLVGENLGEITNSYAAGSVCGSLYVGGLVGGNGFYYVVSKMESWRDPGYIYNCYSVGSVTAQAVAGGLVGDHSFGEIQACFWDTQTSGQATSAGGEGKTTIEMQTASTFLDAGWDFVGETANGTEDIWWINEGQDYPRLWWEAGGN